mmetsp:Transcript_23324/g.38555  ORF Transcript_23324/g.38555 Transcript_23324/m.38555 type:complete len:130 (+) Transcript_23324:68-457(+)
MWQAGQRAGVGRCEWAPHSLLFPGGAVFIGEWCRGLPHGAGTRINASGVSEEGWWAAGSFVHVRQVAGAEASAGLALIASARHANTGLASSAVAESVANEEAPENTVHDVVIANVQAALTAVVNAECWL